MLAGPPGEAGLPLTLPPTVEGTGCDAGLLPKLPGAGTMGAAGIAGTVLGMMMGTGPRSPSRVTPGPSRRKIGPPRSDAGSASDTPPPTPTGARPAAPTSRCLVIARAYSVL